MLGNRWSVKGSLGVAEIKVLILSKHVKLKKLLYVLLLKYVQYIISLPPPPTPTTKLLQMSEGVGQVRFKLKSCRDIKSWTKKLTV